MIYILSIVYILDFFNLYSFTTAYIIGINKNTIETEFLVTLVSICFEFNENTVAIAKKNPKFFNKKLPSNILNVSNGGQLFRILFTISCLASGSFFFSKNSFINVFRICSLVFIF